MRRWVLGAALCCIVVVVVVIAAVWTEAQKALSIEQRRAQRTHFLIQCIELANSNYLEATGSYPQTIDDCMKVAVSDPYCSQPACQDLETRDCILGKHDAWGRPLEFDRRELENGVTKVTVISYGQNGQREYDEHTYEQRTGISDDKVGHFFLGRPSRTGGNPPKP
jgi:hypothetical protein